MLIDILFNGALIDWTKNISSNLRVKFEHLINSDFCEFYTELSKILSTEEPRQLIWHVLNNDLLMQLCNCGNPCKWVKNSQNYRPTCSPKCAGVIRSSKRIKQVKEKAIPWWQDTNKLNSILDKRRKNSLEKYGVDHQMKRPEIREKTKQTNLEKYGVETPWQNPQIRKKMTATFNDNHKPGSQGLLDLVEKRKNSTLKKYGVEFAMQLDDIRNQQQATMLEKYGVKHALQSDKLNQKRQQTNLARFGNIESASTVVVKRNILVGNQIKYNGLINWTQTQLSDNAKDILFNKDTFENELSGKTLNESKDYVGVSIGTIRNYAQKYNLRHIFSIVKITSVEQKIKDLLDILMISYDRNIKSIIPPKELDFYISSNKVAIEINGIYWHSENGGNGKDKNYHLNKWLECQSNGITLLQFTDIDINENFHLVESKIKRCLGISSPIIGARKLKLEILDNNNLEYEFLNDWHIQGSTFNRNLVISATYNDELIGISTWKYKDTRAELVRFATNINFSFPGLLSKMIKKFINNTNFSGKLLSYSNNMYGNGKAYRSCGFEFNGLTTPGYFYTKQYTELESRIKYQKHKLSNIFNLSEDHLKNKTEWDIMQEQGYDRFWDAGHTRWIKHL